MPTLLAFLLLFISIWVTSYLIQTGVIFTGQATPDKTPQNVRIANITGSSFTVAFTTNGKASSGLSVEEVGKNPYLVLDDRDKETGGQTEFYSHYITVSDLSPQTSYNFTIIADGETYQNGDQKYFVRTGPKLNEAPSSQKPIVGRGLLPDGQAALDTIVELQIQGAQKIVALTSDDGKFTIQTNSIRKADLSGYSKLEPETLITLTLRRQDLSSTIQTLLKNIETLAVASLSQDYDFTDVTEVEISTESSILRAPTPKIIPGTIRISTPRENESFVDSKPLFRGTALPNQKVRIKIESEIIIDEVTSDSNGVWTYRPPLSIPPGQHKITIETIDSFGVSKILTQNFAVFAQGSQVAESATPSATPTKTPTPTTPKPTATPTVAPVLSPIATPTLTSLPSITVSPTKIPVITPAPPGNTSSLILTVISVLLIFAGSALLFVL